MMTWRGEVLRLGSKLAENSPLSNVDAVRRDGGVVAREQGEHLRADAQHNRDRILEVARDAFAASGEVSLNSIAKKAGVGPGTLYRHFPSREALLLAEYSPLRALRLWFDRLAYYGRIKHGLADVLHAATSDGLVGETYGPVIG